MNFLTCWAHNSNVLAAVSQIMAVWVTAAGGRISSAESVTAALVVPCTRTGTYRYSIMILRSLLSKHFRWMLTYLLLVLLQVLRIKGTVINSCYVILELVTYSRSCRRFVGQFLQHNHTCIRHCWYHSVGKYGYSHGPHTDSYLLDYIHDVKVAGRIVFTRGLSAIN